MELRNCQQQPPFGPPVLEVARITSMTVPESYLCLKSSFNFELKSPGSAGSAAAAPQLLAF